MAKLRVKKGDMVKILSGDDRGKSGKVVRVLPKESKIVVEGVNIKKKHQRPRKAGEKGQIVRVSRPIHVSKVRKV